MESSAEIRAAVEDALRFYAARQHTPTKSISPLAKIVVLGAFTGGGAQADRLQTENHITLNEIPPPDLVAISCDTLLDPWGHPYVYLSFTGIKGKGKMRKDKHLNPINTQYDLYSLGADGQSRLPLPAPVSQDDVILAYDGNYIGLASNF